MENKILIFQIIVLWKYLILTILDTFVLKALFEESAMI